MGCYDTVMVPCPKCGRKEAFQSKGGDCLLRDFDLDEAPADVLADVNRHAPATCEHCGTLFGVAVVFNPVAKSVVWKPHDEDDVCTGKYVDFQGAARPCLAGGEGCCLFGCSAAHPPEGGW